MSIFTERTIKISADKATMSSDIHIYRGNRNIELLFTITDHQFKFTTTENSGNVIEVYSPSHGYVTLLTPLGTELCSGKAAISNNKLVFKITSDMIDESTEVGDYDIVIDLYDEASDALLTLPPVQKQIHILDRVSSVVNTLPAVASIVDITSSADNPAVINTLKDGVYNFGATSSVKMFEAGGVLTDNVVGVCVLFSNKAGTKRYLHVNYKSTGYTYKYALDTASMTYTSYKFENILSLGGKPSELLIIKDTPLATSGMFTTMCSGIRMLSGDGPDKTVSLGSGKKTIWMKKSTAGTEETYLATIITPDDGIMRVMFVYDSRLNVTTSADGIALSPESQPIITFNSAGDLEVTILGETKTFAPKIV